MRPRRASPPSTRNARPSSRRSAGSTARERRTPLLRKRGEPLARVGRGGHAREGLSLELELRLERLVAGGQQEPAGLAERPRRGGGKALGELARARGQLVRLDDLVGEAGGVQRLVEQEEAARALEAQAPGERD